MGHGCAGALNHPAAAAARRSTAAQRALKEASPAADIRHTACWSAETESAMETPLVITVLLVLVGAVWHRRFVRATRERRAEPFCRASVAAGVLLLAVGVMLFGGRISTPTMAETVATVFFNAGGATLLFLGAAGWATSNDTAIRLLNLTGETLVFVAPDGEPLFTLHPQFGRAAASLPPPLPGLYLIVPPSLLESDEAASRTDLRVVDAVSSWRAGDSRRVLVRRLRARA
jgi:hypothetical protein